MLLKSSKNNNIENGEEKMKQFQWIPIFSFFVMIFMMPTVYAHGNLEHILGTVTSISENSLVIETKKGETKTVEINSSTQYVFKGNPSSLDSLKKGMRVVVHAKKSGDKLEAKEVKFGTPAKKHSSSTQQ